MRVQDSGPGVPKKLIGSIFHPFVTTKREGIGVGLAISQTIVRAHQGELKHECNPDGGATFIVTLPAEDKADG
jgi:two-component system sensor kinase FixL